MEQKVQEMYICGFPFDEVVKILTIYRETGHSEQDYIEGFKDGVNKAYEEMQTILKTEVVADDNNGRKQDKRTCI